MTVFWREIGFRDHQKVNFEQKLRKAFWYYKSYYFSNKIFIRGIDFRNENQTKIDLQNCIQDGMPHFSSKIRPKTSPRRPKTPQGSPGRPKRRFKSAQDIPKTRLGRPPKRPPRRPSTRQSRAMTHPGSPKIRPRRPIGSKSHPGLLQTSILDYFGDDF